MIFYAEGVRLPYNCQKKPSWFIFFKQMILQGSKRIGIAVSPINGGKENGLS